MSSVLVVEEWELGGRFEANLDGVSSIGALDRCLVRHFRLHLLSWDVWVYGLHVSRSITVRYDYIWY